MADELGISLSINYTKDKVTLARTINQKITVSGADYSDQTQDVGNGEHEALSINADIGTAGMVQLRNLDSTNFVEVGIEVSSTFYPLLKLKPGEAQWFRLSSGAPFVKASTAPVKIQVLCFED